jgi:hypothetical protein
MDGLAEGLDRDGQRRGPEASPTIDQRDDGIFFPALLQAVEAALHRGVSREVAIEAASKAATEAMPILSGQVAARLHQTKPELMAELTKDRQLLVAEIEKRWGRALATYEAVAYATYELGAALHVARHSTENQDAATDHNGDETGISVNIISLLHGRACTVAAEVLCLLRGGFADGAAARQRTLHELAVVINLITRDVDLAHRYADYAIVEQREDMRTYQRHAEALGRAPFPQVDVDRLEAQYEEVLQRRGERFGKWNQWAAPLFPGRTQITFVMLEEKAQLAHFRPYYRHANHAVHAGPRAAVLNLHRDNYPWTIGAGARVNVDIAEIGHAALVSLLQCTAPLVTDLPEASGRLDFLLQVQVLQRLTEDAGLAFYRAARAAGFG